MKYTKRIFSLILSVIMMMSVFASTASYTFAGERDTLYVDIFNAYSAPNTRAATNLDYIETSHSEAISAIMNGFNSFSSEINIGDYNLSRNDLVNILSYVESYKLCYFVDSTMNFEILDGHINKLFPKYTMSKSAVIAGNNLINQKLGEVAAEASALPTDIDKIMYVHDYVVDNIDYDYDALDRRDQSVNNIYYAVKDGLTMCVGYAETFYNLLQRLGIKAYIVTSNKNAHAWNLVYLDGSYYHVDCTFDDPTYENASLITNPVSGSFRYDSFMASSTVLVGTGHKPSDWEVNGINVFTLANSYVYDDYFWRDIEEHIVFANGCWYVPFTNDSTSSAEAGFKISEVKFLNNTRYNIKQVRDIKSYYTVDGAKSTVYFPVLQSLDNTLYYRTSNGIFAYNPNSNSDICIYAPTMKGYNIYDFVINPEKGTFSVMYGVDYKDNGVLLEYNIEDYFCAKNHHYMWHVVNEMLVKRCEKCFDELKKLQFTDLSRCVAYGDYIEYTSSLNQFITGTNPPARTLFSPTTPITRAMFITILYRMAGEPYKNANPYNSSPFSDIKDTSVYYYDAACWALDNNITTQTTFKPYDNVSREQTASFLFRYANENGYITDDAYKKVNLSVYHDYNNIRDWSKEAMQWANYNGMITGTQQGYANPQGSTQRIHATKILYGFGKTCNIGNFE